MTASLVPAVAPKHRRWLPHFSMADRKGGVGDYSSKLMDSCSVPRIAVCANCRGDIYSRVGEKWTHDHNGSYWCELDQSYGVYSWAFPHPLSVEWVKSLSSILTTYNGSRRHVMVHTSFHKPKHKG